MNTNNSSIKGYFPLGIALLVMSFFFSFIISTFISLINLTRLFESLFIILFLTPFITADLFLFFMGLLLIFGKREIFFKEKETISLFKLFGIGVGGTHYADIQDVDISPENLNITIAPSYAIAKESSPFTPVNKSLKEIIKILKNMVDARTSYENYENAQEILIVVFIFLLNNGYITIKKSTVSNYFLTYKIKSKSDKNEIMLFRTNKTIDSYLENSLESKIITILSEKLAANSTEIYHSYKTMIKSFFTKSESYPEAFICNIVRESAFEKGFFIKDDKNLYKISEIHKNELNSCNKILLNIIDDFKFKHNDIYQIIKKEIKDAFEDIKPSD